MGNGFLYGKSGGGNRVAAGEHIPTANLPHTTVSINCDFKPDHILLYLYSLNGQGSVNAYYALDYLLYNVNDGTWKFKGNNSWEYDNTNIITIDDAYVTGFNEVPTFNEEDKTFYTGELSYVNTDTFAPRMNYSKNFIYRWIAWKE